MPPRIQNNVFSDSTIEPLFGTAAVVVAAGPALALGYSSSFFVDAPGTPAGASNMAQVAGDSNLWGGAIPQSIGFELFDLAIWCTVLADASVPTEASILALGHALRVRLHYADQPYELGPLGLFLGPFGAPTGMNNVVQPRKLAAAIPGEVQRGFMCEPAQAFKLELLATRAISAGAAVATYVFYAAMTRRLIRRGAAAVRQ